MLVTALTAFAATFLTIALPFLATRKAGYSHFQHTISELGETGARDERFVAFGLFLPVGLLALAVAYLIHPASPQVAALAACIATGYVGAAIFPCDPGSPLSGTARQALHNIAGAVEYVGGGLSLTAIAPDLGDGFRIAGFVVLAVGVALSIVPARAGRGLVQRIGEAFLFGGLLVAVSLAGRPG